jgi:hypothetical protein
MARYSLTYEGITLTAVADTTNYTDNTYPFFLQGGNSTMKLNINEVYSGGESSSSAITKLKLARDSTVAATGISGGRNAALGGATVAPGTLAVFGNTSTTKPQRSSTLHLLGLTYNAFGGIVRWQARPGEEISIVGNTASLGECSLSAFTAGTGIVSGHCLYEEE